MNTYSNNLGKISPDHDKTFSFLQQILLLSIPIFALSLIGIFSRPAGTLAAVWPANAFFLGVLIRYPRLRNCKVFFYAFISYACADFLVRTSLEKNIILNLGNLVSVGAGLLCLKVVTGGIFPISQPINVIKLVICSAGAAVGASFVGMVAYPLLFGGSVSQGALYWGISEFAHYITFLPLVLTTPDLVSFVKERRVQPFAWDLPLLKRLLPGLTVLLLCYLTILIEGPGAIAIPVIGLLWCAMSYSVFTTTLLTLFFCFWMMLTISAGYVTIFTELSSWGSLMSLRLSISIIALVPLIVCTNNHTRLKQIAALQHSSSHDSLTGALNRGAFYQKLDEQLHPAEFQPFTLLMLDLDHFKKINDQFGHSSGDQVLQHFVHSTRSLLRSEDVIARIGGEEFAIILKAREEDSARIAQRICDNIANTPCYIDNTFHLPITVSIGALNLQHSEDGSEGSDNLMKIADEALYKAKKSGRNQVQFQEIQRRSN